MRASSRLFVALLATSLLSACKGLSDITAPKPVDTPVAVVELSSEQLTLGEGASAALQVTARDVDLAAHSASTSSTRPGSARRSSSRRSRLAATC